MGGNTRDGSTPFSRMTEAPASRGLSRFRTREACICRSRPMTSWAVAMPVCAGRIHGSRRGSARARGCPTVVNVGAGAGSYEPADRRGHRGRALGRDDRAAAGRRGAGRKGQRGSAAVRGRRFDAAMAVLTVHHWADLGVGLRELRRVARRRMRAGHLRTECAERTSGSPTTTSPRSSALKRRASASQRAPGGAAADERRIQPLPVPRDCADLFFAALWARPEMLLDDDVVRPMWVWQASPRRGGERAGSGSPPTSRAAPGSGATRTSRTKAELDVGLRLVVSELDDRSDRLTAA